MVIYGYVEGFGGFWSIWDDDGRLLDVTHGDDAHSRPWAVQEAQMMKDRLDEAFTVWLEKSLVVDE